MQNAHLTVLAVGQRGKKWCKPFGVVFGKLNRLTASGLVGSDRFWLWRRRYRQSVGLRQNSRVSGQRGGVGLQFGLNGACVADNL